MHVVENKSFRRFKVLSYDPKTNFCRAIPFDDDVPSSILNVKSEFMEEFTKDEEGEPTEEESALVA